MTPKTFRKTVATLLARELDPKAAADQLGHTSSEVTSRHYIERAEVAPDRSAVLDRLGENVEFPVSANLITPAGQATSAA